MPTAAKPPLYGRAAPVRAGQPQRSPARRLLGLALLLLAAVAVYNATGTGLEWYAGSASAVVGADAAAAGSGDALQDPLTGPSPPSNPARNQDDTASAAPPSPPAQAELPAIEVAPAGEDACAAAAGVPKVALLFLTQGPLHHEALWQAWLASAGGLLPREAGCLAPSAAAGAAARCAAAAEAAAAAGDVLAAQHLFSVYVHAPPAVSVADMGPLFGPRLVTHRVTPEWGGPLLVVASRHLLWQAFRDPANTRFLLVSESDVPLWHPAVTWRQLTALPVSLTYARPRPDDSGSRWVREMATHPGRVFRTHWRKSSQWFELTRDHASVVLSDELVYRAFEAHCRAGWDAAQQRTLDCYPDEHYVPTLLALRGLEEATVAGLEGSAYAEWRGREPHPVEFEPGEVTVEAFRGRIGVTPGCGGGGEGVDRRRVGAAVAAGFLRVEDLGREEECPGDVEAVRRLPLNATCFITARKFGAATAAAVLDVALRCGAEGVGLLDDDVCAAAGGKAPEHWWRRRRRE